jgi:endoglycosylceramidase
VLDYPSMIGTRLWMGLALCMAGGACGGETAVPADDGSDEPDVGVETDGGEAEGIDADGAAADADVEALDDADAPDDGGEPPLYWTDGPLLRDRRGRAIVLRGVNIATGDLERWTVDDPAADVAAFANIARSGFNAVRLVINWDRIEPDAGVSDADYVALVARHARMAADEGLYVLVDMHQDLYGIGFGLHGAPRFSCDEANYAAWVPVEPWIMNYFSAEVSACFDHFWKTPEIRRHQEEAARAVAERIADNDLVVGFDPFNEPFPGTIAADEFDTTYLLPFYAEFAGVVGAVLPGRLFFFEPTLVFGLTCRSVMPGPLTTFAGVFAPHYYNPSVELNLLWDGNDATVGDAVGCAADVAERLDVPLAHGELGGARETPNLADYLLALYGFFDQRMTGSFIWIYSKGTAGFGLVEEATGGWTAAARAYLRPAPSAVGGTPESFAWDTDARVFTLAWTDGGAEGTEILLPAWIATVGYTCLLDGSAWAPVVNATGDRILIPPGAGGERSFRMQVNGPYPE